MCKRRTTRTIRAEHDTTRNYYIYKLRRIWSTWILVLITSVFVLYSSFRYTVSPPNLEPSEIEERKAQSLKSEMMRISFKMVVNVRETQQVISHTGYVKLPPVLNSAPLLCICETR